MTQDTDITLQFDENGAIVDDFEGHGELESFLDKKRRYLGSGWGLSIGDFQDQQIMLYSRVPKCDTEKCLQHKLGYCQGQKTSPHCTKVVGMIIPVAARYMNEYFGLEPTDFMDVGIILVPMYIRKFSVDLGIGEWGEIGLVERSRLVQSYDFKIINMKKEFDRKLRNSFKKQEK